LTTLTTCVGVMLHTLLMVPFMWFRLSSRRDTISRPGESAFVKQNLRRLVQMRSARPITAEVIVSVGSVPTTGLKGIFGGKNLKISLKQTAERWFSRADFSGLDADTQARIEEAADNIGYAPATDFQSSMAFSGNPEGEIDYEAEMRAREFLKQKHGITLRLTQSPSEPLVNDDIDRIFFVCKEGRALDPDRSSHIDPDQSPYVDPPQPLCSEPTFDFGVQVSELVDQEPQLLVTHAIEPCEQESLLIVQATELEQETEPTVPTNDTVDCTRTYLESCAELDPLVPPSEKILSLVPDTGKSKKGTKAQSKSAPRQSRKQKKKTAATKSKKLQPVLA
jgi:hypothetical protein